MMSGTFIHQNGRGDLPNANPTVYDLGIVAKSAGGRRKLSRQIMHLGTVPLQRNRRNSLTAYKLVCYVSII